MIYVIDDFINHKETAMNIEYLFLKRSALQFRQDLIDIDEILNLLSPEEVFGLASYIDSIKWKMKPVEEKITKRLMQGIK